MVVINAMERLKRRGSVSQLSVWDLLDLKVHLVAMGCLVEMGLLGLLELLVWLVHLVSLARMATLAYQAEMAMMVCQVHQGLKVKMVSMERLDLLEHLVCLDLRGHQEHLVLGEGLVTRELMVLWDHLGHLDPVAR